MLVYVFRAFLLIKKTENYFILSRTVYALIIYHTYRFAVQPVGPP